jgi:hypothetical protein
LHPLESAALSRRTPQPDSCTAASNGYSITSMRRIGVLMGWSDIDPGYRPWLAAISVMAS